MWKLPVGVWLSIKGNVDATLDRVALGPTKMEDLTARLPLLTIGLLLGRGMSDLERLRLGILCMAST